MNKKIDLLREYANKGNWDKAIKLAAKFPRLGEHRGAILDADLAIKHPHWCNQLKKDKEELIRLGIEALTSKYSL